MTRANKSATQGCGRDLRDELEKFDGTYPESWRPEVGEILVGTIVRYETGSTNYGSYPICVVRDEQSGAERSVWLLHAVLRDEFEKQKPLPGERCGIKRLPDSDKNYKRYVVRIDRDQPDLPDFSQFAPAGDVPPEEPGPAGSGPNF